MTKNSEQIAGARVAAKLSGSIPDPDGMNDERAGWAGAALAEFQKVVHCDDEDLAVDFLVDLMHWCDRNSVHAFDDALRLARDHYEAETTEA